MEHAGGGCAPAAFERDGSRSAPCRRAAGRLEAVVQRWGGRQSSAASTSNPRPSSRIRNRPSVTA